LRSFQRTSSYYLRKFKAALRFIENGELTPSSCFSAYLSQLPSSERKLFSSILDRFEQGKEMNSFLKALNYFVNSIDYHPHPQFLDDAMNAVSTAKSGFHILFGSSSECG
jgi:hypothetical protein